MRLFLFAFFLVICPMLHAEPLMTAKRWADICDDNGEMYGDMSNSQLCFIYALSAFDANPNFCLPKSAGQKMAAINLAKESVRDLIKNDPEVADLPAAHVLSNLGIMHLSYPCENKQ